MNLRTLLPAALLFVSSCAAAPGPMAVPKISPDIELVGRTFFEGFDAREDSPAAWRPGDRLLFGLASTAGSANVERLIRFEVTSIDLSRGEPLAEVDVRVFDEAGAFLEASTTLVQIANFSGFFEACVVAAEEVVRIEEAAAAGRLEEVLYDTRAYRGALAASELFRALQSNPALERVLWEVVDMPSFLSVLTNLGVKLGLSVHFDESTMVADVMEASYLREGAFDFPLRITLNDQPALDVSLRVVTAAPPLHLSAGVLSFEASHPTDPSRRATMRVLAARRGLER